MKPDAEIKAIQARVNKLLSRVLGDLPDRPVKVLVRGGQKEGTTLMTLSYEGRWLDNAYEPGQQRLITLQHDLLLKWTDLALAGFLAKEVKELLQPEVF